MLWTCVSKIASSGNPGGAVAVLPPFTAFALHPYIRRSSPFTSGGTEDAVAWGLLQAVGLRQSLSPASLRRPVRLTFVVAPTGEGRPVWLTGSLYYRA